MFKSLIGLATDTFKIVSAPVEVAVDITRTVTKPLADVADEVTKEVKDATKELTRP